MARKREEAPRSEEESVTLSDPDTADDTSSETDASGNDKDDTSDIELSFTGYNMSRSDYHSIRNFLSHTFGHSLQSMRGGEVGVVEVGGLARMLVEVLGEYVGTTAKTEEGEDPLAFVSILPMRVPNELFYGTNDPERLTLEQMEEMIETFRGLLMETARKSRAERKVVQKAEAALMTRPERTAVVFQERFMNLPVEMGAPLYRQLLDDLPAAQEESACFAPTTILLIVPIYRELDSQLDTELPSERKKRRKAAAAAAAATAKAVADELQPSEGRAESTHQYYYAEDELLEHMDIAYWDFKVKTPHETSDSRRAFGDRGVEPARRVFLLSMEEFGSFVDQCQALID